MVLIMFYFFLGLIFLIEMPMQQSTFLALLSLVVIYAIPVFLFSIHPLSRKWNFLSMIYAFSVCFYRYLLLLNHVHCVWHILNRAGFPIFCFLIHFHLWLHKGVVSCQTSTKGERNRYVQSTTYSSLEEEAICLEYVIVSH